LLEIDILIHERDIGIKMRDARTIKLLHANSYITMNDGVDLDPVEF